MGIISRLNEEGTTVLMISHDMEVVADYAKRAMVLSGGRMTGDGSVRDIMKNSAVMEEASLLPAQIPSLAMAVGGIFKDAFTIDEMVCLAEQLRKEEKEAEK
jgi:energy-coupling factor transport system ATP-binding protein